MLYKAASSTLSLKIATNLVIMYLGNGLSDVYYHICIGVRTVGALEARAPPPPTRPPPQLFAIG